MHRIIIITAIQLGSYHGTAFATDPTLHATTFICLTELVLGYSICSANFPAFRRLTSDIRTDFGGFGGVTSINASRGFSSGYIRSGKSGGGPESDTFPMTAHPATRASGSRSTRVYDVTQPFDDRVGYSCEARHGDTASLSSDAVSEHQSEDMIIRTRTDIRVGHEDE